MGTTFGLPCRCRVQGSSKHAVTVTVSEYVPGPSRTGCFGVTVSSPLVGVRSWSSAASTPCVVYAIRRNTGSVAPLIAPTMDCAATNCPSSPAKLNDVLSIDNPPCDGIVVQTTETVVMGLDATEPPAPLTVQT